ncbi:MAG TPA: M64 family metallopeptidase [Pyrinomonadaceae bacterium]|jgi:hypothetical protein
MKFPPRRFSALIFLLLLLALPRAASAEPFETIVNNGSPENRVDIAIMGDGYTAAEMDKYRSDIEQFVRLWFEQEPYKEYQRYFNVHRIDVVSAQSGADHPERGSFVNTAFNATYRCEGTQRAICVDFGRAFNVLNNSFAPSQFDIKLVIVNDPEYGGSGGQIAVASTEVRAVELILHEVGHSFGLLGDEYGGSHCTVFGEPSALNLMRKTNREEIKWLHWIDPSTPVPTTTTTNGVPGLYEGALYCNNGYHRPTFNSKMRSLSRPFDQINTEQHIRRIYNFVSPLDASAPSGATLTLTQGQAQDFSVSPLSPLTHALAVTWFVDGTPRSETHAFTLDTATLNAGAHTVEVLLRDDTDQVRHDPQQLLAETRKWDVTVNAAATPTPTPTPYPPGQSPVLLTDGDTQRAIALDTVTWLSGPFTLFTLHNFSADQRTRISLFVYNAELLPGESHTAFTAQAEDSQQRTFPLAVEYAAKAPGLDGVTQLVVKLPDELASAGEVLISVSLRGTSSNKASISIRR